MNTKNPYETPGSDLKNETLGQGLNANREYAGFWIRVVASIIDSVLLMAVTIPLLYLIYGSSFMSPEGGAIKGVWHLVISYIFPIVAVVLFWVYKSATPGKMVCGLKVIGLGASEKITVGQAVGRYFSYIPSAIVFGLGYIWVAFDKEKQGWHDKLAKTAVIKSR